MPNRLRACLAALSCLLLPWGAAHAQPAGTAAPPFDCAVPSRPIHEARFVRIGGIEQWITIDGDRCAHPVVLFLHGGPGNPLSPFAQAIYGGWERHFTLVQWDQRGAGRTFGRDPAAGQAALSIPRMAQDGLELAAYLSRYLGQRKLVLFASSWGSVLGMHMVMAEPQRFHAYVGTGQLVQHRATLQGSVDGVLALARAADDTKTVAALEALGAPPWRDPRGFGILRRATRIYEAKAGAVAPPTGWWARAPAYATAQDLASAEAGEDHSYLQFVGLRGDGMLESVDLPALGRDVGVPVFLVHGAQDLVTVPQVAKAYFDGLRAPHKRFVLLEATGHDPNEAMVAAQLQLLLGEVATPRPAAQAGRAR